MSEDVEMRLPLGPWMPEAMEHDNPGLLAARGWQPWATGGWRPYPFFVRPQVNLGGQIYGGHYHVWGDVWEAYVARDNSGDVKITQVDLQVGSPPSTLAIGTATDNTGTSWATTALVDWGYTFLSHGKYVLLAGDETVPLQYRDSEGSSPFADLIAGTSIDRPSARYMASAGRRVVFAYIKHNDATSQANYGSDALTDPNLVIFSGAKSGITYFSTENTADTGSNDWDPEELATRWHLEDELGVITGTATSAHGFGWVWKEGGLYRFDYQQEDADFRLISDQHGTRSPQSIVVVDDAVYFFDQAMHLCRATTTEVVDLSAELAGAALLDDDAVFQGYHPQSDPTQGDNDPGAFVWGNTSEWRASIDVETLLGGTGVHRYPCGYYDRNSGTVRFIYPGTYRRMEGKGTISSGTTTLNRTSGTTFVSGFMDDRAIDIDAGTLVTTVASVTSGVALETADPAPSTLTNVDWFITFQRYLELVYQPATGFLSATDVTHAHEAPSSERPWQMHWGISAPGFGARLKPSSRASGYPQRMSYGPSDVLYGFIYTTVAGVDFYSLTYAWPYGDAGYLLLDDPTVITACFSIPDQAGSSAALSNVVGIRPVYTPRRLALANGIDITAYVVVYSKVRSGSNRDSSGALQGELVSNEQAVQLGAAVVATDPRGFKELSSKAGNYHILSFRIPVLLDGDFPIAASEIISALHYIDVRLRPVMGAG